jgi:hypothetical protein
MLDVPRPKAKRAHLWERADAEFYIEPSRVTRQLLGVERFVGTVWDPACGQGNVIRAAHADGLAPFGTDIVRRTDAPWFMGEHDFLGDKPPRLRFDNIITNPPFGKAKTAEAFIRKALSITPSKVAAFVDIRFIAGAQRAAGLFSHYPPARVWIVTPRASCPPGSYLAAGGKAGNGSSDYVWLVWDCSGPAAAGPALGWLR